MCSPEISSNTDELGNVTDTCPHMEPDAKTSSEKPQNSLTNPRSSKYNLRHNPKPNCNDEGTKVIVTIIQTALLPSTVMLVEFLQKAAQFILFVILMSGDKSSSWVLLCEARPSKDPMKDTMR